VSTLKFFSPEVLYSNAHKIYKYAGLSDEDAHVLTKVLIDTELRGMPSHGLMRTIDYIRCIQSGGIKPKGEYVFKYDSPSWASIDGLGGLGVLIANNAMELAIQKAERTGIGAVNVCNSHHLGATGQYTLMCARKNMFGLAMSNGNVIMAVTGGRDKSIGNNPMSYSAPAGKYNYILYDVAMSKYSDGKIQVLKAMGEKLPPECALDKNGEPTTVPDEYLDGGTLLPFGGYKGYGLAIMVEVLSAVLSGAAITEEVDAWNEKPGKSGNTGHFFLALDIQRLMPIKEFISKIEGMIDKFKQAPLAKGYERIMYPGELEQEFEHKARKEGIGLTEPCLYSLYEAASMVGCELNLE